MAVLKLVVPGEAEGMRADVFLRKYAPSLPEPVIRSSFSRRDVKLDGIRIAKNLRVVSGQTVLIYYPEPERNEPLDIVYEDGDVLLVNKRPGISVEADPKGGLSLSDLCLQHVQSRGDIIFPPAPCHRLDHKTSGLCLFAKNENSLRILTEVFRARTLDKQYECLVRGIPKPPSATCHAYLLKNAEEAKVTVWDHPVPGSKPIVTGYETLSAGPVSRLRVHLITGRTHQIRAHLAALGHPLLGDDLYGDRGFNHLQKVRSLRLCAVSLQLDTGGALPSLDGVCFRIDPPF